MAASEAPILYYSLGMVDKKKALRYNNLIGWKLISGPWRPNGSIGPWTWWAVDGRLDKRHGAAFCRSKQMQWEDDHGRFDDPFFSG